jgi:hypothetical protein
VAIHSGLSGFGIPEENFFKILDFTAVDFDPFGLEHLDFFLDRASRRLPLKPPNPPG